MIVTNISIKGEIDILMFKSRDCYDDSVEFRESNNGSSLRVQSFTVSVTKNKFVAVGCDTYAYLNGKLNGSEFSTGCLSKCKNIQNIVDGNCSGIGCCQIPIPEGLKRVSFKAYNFNRYEDVWDFSPCSYAFIIQEDKFKFSSDNLTSLRNTRRLFRWFLIGQLVTRGVKLLRTKRITYVEQIAYVLISILTAGQGIVAIARTVTKGTHTS